jgi:cysteine desulfurase
MMERIYLDHNATTPLRASAKQAMIDLMGQPINASSVHADGRLAQAALEQARNDIAKTLHVLSSGVIFTSGGSEACNLAVAGAQKVGQPIERRILSAVEHSAVSASVAQSDVLRVDEYGCVDLEHLETLLQGQAPALVCVMLANNETGVVQPIREIADLVHAHDGIVFCDATQAIGKIEVSFIGLGVDMMALSAHKFGGPLGAGALLIAPKISIDPIIRGGGQELRRRAGTQNLPAIVAMRVALTEAIEGLPHAERMARCRDDMEEKMRADIPECVVFSSGASRLPNTSCFSAPGLSAEKLVMALDLAGLSVSSGAACSSGKVTNSHVLAAMNVPHDLAQGAIRVSFGWNSDLDRDGQKLVDVWTREARRMGQWAAE